MKIKRLAIALGCVFVLTGSWGALMGILIENMLLSFPLALVGGGVIGWGVKRASFNWIFSD